MSERPSASRPCLVTGATGFIGGRLAARLAARGDRVRCLARASSDTSALSALDVEIVTGELEDAGSLARAVDGCGRVFHCAALVTDWATVAEIRRANVSGTRMLLDACAGTSVERVVHLSTTDVYGHPGRAGLEESQLDRRAPRFANWYAQTKLEAEAEVRRAGAAHGFSTVILRPATVYGPGSHDVVGEIARALRARQMLLIAGGRSVAGLTYVENVVDAALLAAEHPVAAGDALNISDGLPVTWRQFTDDLAGGLGCPPARLAIPRAAAAAIGVSLERCYRLLRRASGLRLTMAPLLSRQAVQVLGIDQDFSNLKARTVLGWEPRVGYAEGLAATLDWLRHEQPPIA